MTDGSAHVAFMVPATDEIRRRMGITDPHTSLTWDIVTLGARNYTIDDFERLSIGTIRGHDFEAWLDVHHPGLDYISVDGHVLAFEALLSGRIDALVETWPVAEQFASELGIGGLRSSGSVGPDVELSIAYTKRHPELGPILSKALASIPDADRIAMLERAVGGRGSSLIITVIQTFQEVSMVELHFTMLLSVVTCTMSSI